MRTIDRPAPENDQTLLRNFEGIYIPADVWLSKRLTWAEKGLVAEIKSLSTKGKGCFASNQYLAAFLGVTERQTRSLISKMKNVGIIYQQSFDGRTRYLAVDQAVLAEQTGTVHPGTTVPGREEVQFHAGRKSDRHETASTPLNTKGLTPTSTKSIVKSKESKEENFSNPKESFDPEDLPVHIGKDPSVMEAWLMFVQHRKDIKKPLNKNAYNLLVKKMLRHVPNDIVSELHKAVECGWRSIFYNDKQTVQGHSITPTQSDLPTDNSDYGNMMGIKDKDFVR